MSTYRFVVHDTQNEWFKAVEVDADEPDQARRRAEAMLFARRPVGANTGVTIEEDHHG